MRAEALRGTLYVRFVTDVDGRLRPVDLVILGDEESEITSGDLRNLPLHRLTAAVNHKILGFFTAPSSPDDVKSAPRRAIGAQLEGLFDSVSDQMDELEGSARAARKAAREGVREPVRRPAGRDLPEDFFQTVAAAYKDAVDKGASPGRLIADEADVSLRTAQGWIADARRRGFLPPARQGRAG
ncbi:hypothetical protein [Frankia sp. Cr1]|uniref:hypothetical protein n=1 Tax=Frankia sp. Cr1 TaxID=3073931 RepID=UPI002AD28BBE|nr:hypothetical protein [Frankia sp. Cr1]